MDDGVELAERVSRGSLPREGLELLSRLGHAGARRALGRLPLDLTQVAAARWPEDDPPASSDHWRSTAAFARSLERSAVVKIALAFTSGLSGSFDREKRESVSALMGLYTGPAGAVVLSAPVVAATFPLGASMRRVSSAASAWLAAPSEEAARALVAAWPAVLASRARTELCAELTRVSWPAVWAHRWLIRCVTDEDAGAALACVAAYAEEASEDRAGLLALARDAAIAALLHPGEPGE